MDEEKKTILEKHNYYRSRADPPAADMKSLHWDKTLEDLATSYAAKCIWEHNEERGFRGENLFLMSGSSLDVDLGMDDWHKERDYYNFTTDACQEGKMCGHYTQMVWADTERVGCGEKFCEKVEGFEEPNMYLLVCNYEPPGNFQGEQPYTPGEPCSSCPSSHICKDSLCVDETLKQEESSTAQPGTTSFISGVTRPWQDPELTQSELVPKSPQPELLSPEPSQSELTPEPTQPELTPEPTQPELTPEQSQLTPETTQTELTPETTQSELTPETTQSELTPETTQSELTPETTQSELTPETTQSELTPETTQSELTPETTQSELTPETTQSELTPEPTHSEIIPSSTKSTQSEMIPKGTWTELDPQVTSLKVDSKPTPAELLEVSTEPLEVSTTIQPTSQVAAIPSQEHLSVSVKPPLPMDTTPHNDKNDIEKAFSNDQPDALTEKEELIPVTVTMIPTKPSRTQEISVLVSKPTKKAIDTVISQDKGRSKDTVQKPAKTLQDKKEKNINLSSSKWKKPLSSSMRWDYKSGFSERTYFGRPVHAPHFVQAPKPCKYPCLRSQSTSSMVFPLYRTNHISSSRGYDEQSKWISKPQTKSSYKQLCKLLGYKKGVYSLYLPKAQQH
ncbi:peptidase inhibitor 16-like [Hyla sarda]|uniref:peptidase inhibitor 16-like n=1 Tax=Hyla sarda TaxID=327740 RepID=UPI0024C45F44|nr:peptidase inhibitor 16-like [Hyla sarda]